VESRVEAILERGHRGWECQDLHGGSWWLFERWSPSVECEGFEMSIENQVWLAGLRVEDDCSDRQDVEIAGREDPILSSDEPTSRSVSLCGEAPVELHCQHRAAWSCFKGHRIAIGEVVGPPAKPARSMTGSQSHCIVEKEQRRPDSRCIQRMEPVLELELTGDPQ